MKSGTTAVVYHNMAVVDAAETRLLIEKYAGRIHELPKGYSLRYDVARVPHCQDHIHIFRRRNEIGVVNIDGSGHDNAKFQIPGAVADFVKRKFPDFVIPPRRMVEAYSLKDSGILQLLEDIKKGESFETLIVIDVDEINTLQEDDDMIRMTIELLDYFSGRKS